MHNRAMPRQSNSGETIRPEPSSSPVPVVQATASANESLDISRSERRARKALWSLLAVVLALALAVGASWLPVGYVIMSPGPTVNVLGDQGETTVLEFSQSGEDDVLAVNPSPSTGELLMVTVSSVGGPGSTVRLGNVVRAWFTPGVSIRKYSDLYGEDTTAEQVAEAGAAQMESSHSAAAIAAMDYLGLPMDTTMIVAGVSPDADAADKLEVDDVLASITTPDGVVHPITSPSTPFSLMETIPPGSRITVTVERDGQTLPIEVTTTSLEALTGSEDDGDEDDAQQSGSQEEGSRMGIYLSADTDLPIEVTIHLEKIGGPSAGLAFALGIVDELTEGGILGDEMVAATGALDFAGNVVSIGGIEQKMYGAKRDGAEWFLAPEDNCDDVVGNVPDGLRVVPVATLAEGVEAVEQIAAGATAELPTCPAE